jgi:hypothetical protein
MGKRLTPAQQHTYVKDGLVFPVRVLSAAEAHSYRTACDQLEVLLGGKPRTVEVRQLHLHFPWAHELATHPAVLDVVEDILGPDLLLWCTELFAKHAHDATVAIHWHRDRPYMGLADGRSATAWIALGRSTPANGCMRAVPASRERPGLDAAAQEAIDVVLQAGEMSLHGPDVWHGSGPNQAGQKRVGFVARYVTPDAQPVAGRPPAVLVRGRDDYHHFGEARPPAAGPTPEALAGLKASALQHLEVILRNLRSTEGATDAQRA